MGKMTIKLTNRFDKTVKTIKVTDMRILSGDGYDSFLGVLLDGEFYQDTEWGWEILDV